MGWGDYPDGYNRHIHGPFDPSRYYGKPDTPFVDVKIGELPRWLSRRSMNPRHWVEAMGRFASRWQDKWLHPKRPSAAGLYQLIFFCGALGYIANYKKHWNEMNYKYH